MQHHDITAPAKVNLYLHVTGRTDHGFHLLQSLVVFTDFGDEVRIIRDDAKTGLDLTVTGPFGHLIDGPPQDNLVWRAMDEVRKLTGCKAGLTAQLHKNLPVAAGIGGGSADAAAAIRAAVQVLETDVPEPALMALAAGLGADVPACLTGRPLYMQGIGGDITAASVPAGMGIILVNPNIPVATPDIFRHFRATGIFSPSEPGPPKAQELDNWRTELKSRRNDLQSPAIVLCPAIQDVLDHLAQDHRVLISRMSGSGATCFALLDDADTAQALASEIRQNTSWWCQGGAIRN